MKLNFQILLVLSFLVQGITCFGQMPGCGVAGSSMIYYLGDDSLLGKVIYDYDPSLPFSNTNPSINTLIAPTPNGKGLAVSTNINGSGASPTFYIVATDIPSSTYHYYYYDGVSWVNTGHMSPANGVNIAAGGGFIYSLDPFSGIVYKYDGTGDATYLTTTNWAQGHAGSFDLISDCQGDFYILCWTTPAGLEEYDPSGNLVQFWPLTSTSLLGDVGDGSLAMIQDTVYSFGMSGSVPGIYKGVRYNGVIDVSFIPSGNSLLGAYAYDAASCQLVVSPAAIVDTVYYCGEGPGVVLNASGQAPYSWSVLNGPAIINGLGASVTVTAAANSVILSTSGGGDCGPHSDSIYLAVPKPVINAGTDDAIISCYTSYLDTLQGSLTATAAGVIYGISWTPSLSILSGAGTLNPVIAPVADTYYILTVATDSTHGSCAWTDSVHISVINSSPLADFDFGILYGCNADTVVFENLSINANAYLWNFADGIMDSSTVSPEHVYAQQNIYNVKLVAKGACTDTIEKIINTGHPLVASFSVDDDTICQGTQINFLNTSTFTTIKGPISFYWSTGSFAKDTAYTFELPGIYRSYLVVSDFVPCVDTAFHTIVVDPYPNLAVTISDTSICEGQAIEFTANYEATGFEGLKWDFGDGAISLNTSPISHAFDTSGKFDLQLNAFFRACPDTSSSRQITIIPFPVLDLGPDTVMCPNSPPIIVQDYHNGANPLASWKWNTGDTSAAIAVRHPGVYTVELTIAGCSSSDSVEVFKDCYIDIPNSFTPNGDGINDYFLPRELLSKSLNGFKMSIYNRWGQLIFETNNIDGRGWDGKLNGVDQSDGVYIYLIEVNIRNGQQEKYQGNLTLLR